MRRQPVVAFLSFRLGGTDGVSIEATKWERAFRQLGLATRRVAGEILDAPRPDDTVVPQLAVRAEVEPDPDALEDALSDVDVVVVENLLSLPLNLGAARAVAKVLDDHDRVILRHHDLPWQRPEFAGVTELPPRRHDVLHVTINDRSRRELAERGVRAHTVRNHFDVDPPPGDRAATRDRLGISDEDLLVLHPVRAIARKNIPSAIELSADLAARLPGRPVHYWLPGPAEDGYGPELDRILREPPIHVLRNPDVPIHDAYAACDIVVFPSTWEGFGNPVVESVAARRPLVVAGYPVLDELHDLGFEFLSIDRPGEVAGVVAGTVDVEPQMRANLRAARTHLSLDLLPTRLAALFDAAGWKLP